MSDTAVRRTYKDSLFRMVFREKTELLSLYNAINDTSYDNPEELTITTIDDVLYLSLKNDISFLIEEILNLYEGQSTWNPNMPLRGVFHMSQLYQAYVKTHHLNIYSSKRLKLPTPRYIVFYNGTREEPDRQMLRLSDAFIKREEQPFLECKALVININYGRNPELMEACRKLHDYSYFVSRVREELDTGVTLEQAVDRAVKHCIKKNILREFLEKHRAEVKNVILTEYDEEEHLRLVYKEGYEEGREEGRAAGMEEGKRAGAAEGRKKAVLELLEDLGPVPERLVQKIMSQEDSALLSKWHKAAAKADTIEDFMRKIE